MCASRLACQLGDSLPVHTRARSYRSWLGKLYGVKRVERIFSKSRSRRLYRMLNFGKAYVEIGQQAYEKALQGTLNPKSARARQGDKVFAHDGFFTLRSTFFRENPFGCHAQ